MMRKPKKFNRSDSSEFLPNKRVDRNKNQNEQIEDINTYEVCITSMESLPKQMALAKLLRMENIKGISRIKYKSFNKVLLQFNKEEEANNLLSCQKFKDMGFRCQKVNELSLCYGIVKGVDMDMNENELQKLLESESKIISISRLKRLNADGKWVDSETVRICFEGNTLPTHVYAYDCRFKVDAYVFPVTQCSGCWQFGHVLKYCPTKKKLCPKCGGSHENCDTKELKCLNCKGPHITPVQREARVFNTNLMEQSGEIALETRSSKETAKNKKPLKTKQRIETTQFEAEQVVETESGASQKEEVEKGNQQDEQLRYRFEFTKLILKMKGILMSEDKLEAKIISVLRMIWEEILKVILSMFSKGDVIEKMFNFINGSRVSAQEMWRRMRWIKGHRETKSYPPPDKQKELLYSLTPDYVLNSMPTFTSDLPVERTIDFRFRYFHVCYIPSHQIVYSKTLYDPNILINNVIVELNEYYAGWHKIFTDGSKSNMSRGAGFYDKTLQHEVGFKIEIRVPCNMWLVAPLVAEARNVTHIESTFDSNLKPRFCKHWQIADSKNRARP
ncbi:hypothetical protein HW555_008879 [Spodoptera exigua]|uniref:Uncharacterized protein n=1 Tax=Spodoptera exigua TaxID=7107 RepID=A0A835GC68_SPOEX|nr:hypothetical protein HW555_008879 [Spodoptera exigua]